MFKTLEFKLIAIVLIGVLSFMGVQQLRISSLKTDLTTISKTAEEQGKKIDTLEKGVKSLQDLDESRKDNRATRDSSNNKMTKDSKRKDVVAKKPGLVEKQINDSFNKFAEDIQEITK